MYISMHNIITLIRVLGEGAERPKPRGEGIEDYLHVHCSPFHSHQCPAVQRSPNAPYPKIQKEVKISLEK